MKQLAVDKMAGAAQVYSCAVLRDPGSGLNRGYGFIKFKSKEIAQKAMAKLNDTEMKDQPGTKVPTSSPPAPPACLAALPSGVHAGFHLGSAQSPEPPFP